MPAKWHKYSYSAQIEERRSILTVIVLVLSLALLFTVINRWFITMYYVESSTMEPTIKSGECIVATPLYSNKTENRAGFSLLVAPQRGDLVVVAPAYAGESGQIVRSLNSLVAFITFQRFRPFDRKDTWGEKPVIRRVVAFPGDTIYMENFVLHVKTGDSAHYLTEFELAPKTYDLKIDSLPENWSSEMPFSGSFPEMKLGRDEFFVLCDNRLEASDSRVWGTVPAARIRGKVLLRYWPFSHFGIP
jgi:signal peptidase I